MATKKVETAKKAVKEEVKKAETAVKETAEKAKSTVKKTAEKVEKKATEKKTAEKKAPAKKAPAKKTEEVFFEFAGKQINPAEVTEAVKKAYVDGGNKASSIKSMKLYIKAEDSAVYFVINDSIEGKLAL